MSAIIRTPKYLSFSSVNLFYKDRKEFFRKYICQIRVPRLKQMRAAAVGSAFDSMVKASVASEIYGPEAREEYELSVLFEDSVEKQNRDIARQDGQRCFDAYKESGAYDDLMGMFKDAQKPPEFERGSNADLFGIPVFGKTDCDFVNKQSIMVILDWKVKGYCSKYGASPAKGYALCRDGWTGSKGSRSHGKHHKLYSEIDYNGTKINSNNIETCFEKWAQQLSLYGWILGQPIGSDDHIIAIDELCCKFMGEETPPIVRVAQHKSRISKVFQNNYFAKIKECWDRVSSGNIFDENNDEMIQMLTDSAVMNGSGCSDDEKWFSATGRETKFFWGE